MSPPRPTLSACVITLDEEERLPGCLASLASCDEIVVVDSGSTDATVAVARAAGARVITNPWPGFAAQRNRALEAATGEWVLEVDADERLEPKLAAGIDRFLRDAELREGYDMALLPMRHRFLGRTLWAAMQAPGYRPRLFRRASYRHDEGRTVHEGLWPQGPAYPLDDGAMVHELADGWSEALGDVRAYARLEAAQFDGRVSPGGAALGVLARPAAKAAYRLLVDGGWREGWQGPARIGLESLSDALTWMLLLRAGPRAGGVRHVGSAPVRQGPPKVLGIARTARTRAAMAGWLREAGTTGAEAVLIAPPGDPCAPGVRVREPTGAGPLGLVRAINAEHQLRPLDAVLLGGRAAEAALRVSRAGRVRVVLSGSSPGPAVGGLRAAWP